jgi:hypothetical protein
LLDRMKHLLQIVLCSIITLFSEAPLLAHEDTLIQLKEDKLVGLPNKSHAS